VDARLNPPADLPGLLDRVADILKKQRRVEGMVQGQHMPRQDIVETLVHRQHLAELHQLMAPLSTPELGAILEALPLADATYLWAQVPPGRENEVLWEMSDARREQLVGSREPSFGYHVEESGGIYLHSDFLLDKEGDSRSVPVAFILHNNILFSLRNEELPVFRLQRLRWRPPRWATSPTARTCCSISTGPTSNTRPIRWRTSTPTLGKVGRTGAEPQTISDGRQPPSSPTSPRKKT
jgi:hypothetical protein